MRSPVEKQIATLGWGLHSAGVLLVLIAGVAFAHWVLLPLANSQEVCEQRIGQLKVMLAKTKQVQTEHQGLRAELAALKESIAATQQRLPKELDEHEFVDQVHAAAKAHGIEIGDYQLGTIQELASYRKAEVSFLCHGSFASICRFLNEIDHFARITEISNLQLETTDKFNRYPMQVTFVLYFGSATHDRKMRGDVL